jgi:hypothetical protein
LIDEEEENTFLKDWCYKESDWDDEDDQEEPKKSSTSLHPTLVTARTNAPAIPNRRTTQSRIGTRPCSENKFLSISVFF